MAENYLVMMYAQITENEGIGIDRKDKCEW